LLKLLLVLIVFFGQLINQALVVFGMLKIAFGQNAVACRSGVTGKSRVFFMDLVGSAAHAHIGPIAVKRMNPGVDATVPAAMLLSATMMMVPAAAITTA